jgi:hypothetical protein
MEPKGRNLINWRAEFPHFLLVSIGVQEGAIMGVLLGLVVVLST